MKKRTSVIGPGHYGVAPAFFQQQAAYAGPTAEVIAGWVFNHPRGG